MTRMRWAILIVAICLLAGCSEGERAPEVEDAVSGMVETVIESTGPSPPSTPGRVVITGGDVIPAMVRLLRAHPEAEVYKVTKNSNSWTVDKVPTVTVDVYLYNRGRGTFLWTGKTTGKGLEDSLLDVRYSGVTDEILLDLSERGSDEFVTCHDLGGYGCLSESVSDGVVVMRNGEVTGFPREAPTIR